MRHPAYARATLAALLACTAAAVVAEDPNFDDLAPFVYPTAPLSAQDEAWVLYAHSCGLPLPDPTRAPEIRTEDDRTIADLYLLRPAEQVCLAAFLPPVLYHAPLGKRAKGVYAVERRLWVRDEGSNEHVLSRSDVQVLEVGDTPAIGVSGAWYNPDAPGSGLFLSLLPRAQGDHRHTAILYLAEVEGSSTPVWYTAAGEFVDAQLAVELSPGGSGRAPKPQVFAYMGCGQASLYDPRFPTFFTPLEQLTRVEGVPGCAPPGQPFPSPAQE